MNNTVLKLLQIFENETDNEHALTKVEVLQRWKAQTMISAQQMKKF